VFALAPRPTPCSSTSFTSNEIPFAKISFLRIHQIFPKTISQKQFPELSLKNLSGTRNNHPVRDSLKCRIAPFARIPASEPHLMQPTLKTGTKKQPLLSFWQSPAHFRNRSPSQKHNQPLQNFSRTRPRNLRIPAGIPTDDLRRIPLPKITLYYSADPGFLWKPVTGVDQSGSQYPSRVSDLSQVFYPSQVR